MTEDEDEYYDSETEPSFCAEDEEILDKLNDLSFSKSDRKSILPTHQYYAVQILNKNLNKLNPNSTFQSQSAFNRIFINKENAMKLCKQDPDNRRFKLFRNFHDAYAFSYETSEIQSGEAPSVEQLQASLSLIKTSDLNSNSRRSFSNIDRTPESATKNSSQDAEKLPFSAPKKPEVNEMRLFIEKNNFEAFRDKVISNPRFLITAGDAPVIYQEGFRYNALHVCAKENRGNICQLILNLLSNTSFLQKMYRNDSIEQSRARSHHLLDLYINTPEKGLNETPLHFATKFGSFEVTRLLMSFEVCCKNPKNKFGKTPSEIICSKAANEQSKEREESIKNLFEQCFYVPMFRDDDKGDVLIDKPSPKLAPILASNDLDKNSNYTSPNIHRNNSQARKLAGYVGPVSPNVANEIYERLKSPAKLRRSPLNLDILRSDDYKGYERILRKITDEMNLPWCEYWGFLDSYCNLKSKDGLDKLEVYLRQKKFINIINSQYGLVSLISNDYLKNNKGLKSENKEENELYFYLKQFLVIQEQLKSILEIRENLLSNKFQNFVKIMQENDKNLPKIETNEVLNEDNFDIKLIKDTLNRYMTVVIELSRLDKSSKCYFNLYKSSKIILEILKCSRLFENFHMSPIFKKLANPPLLSTSRPLSNTTNTSIWSMRDPNSNHRSVDRIRKPLFNDSDEEDEKNEPTLDDSDEDKNYDEVDDSIVDLVQQFNSNSLNEESLSSKKSSNSLNLKEINKNFDNSEDNEYKLNDIKNKNFLLNKKNGATKDYNLFIFGDTPSKLDRAVYLAIQDCRIESDSYELLSEWFDYMRHFKQSEMQKWKTPMRQNTLVTRAKSFNQERISYV